MSLEEAFWSHVTRTETCWLWTRGLGTSGYGAFRALGRNVPAHRFAYELVTGPVPDGKIVCHTCDNPLCCRNDDEGWYEIDGIALPRRGHLFLGTQKDNAVDRTNKWRHPHGESHPKAKLTDNDVVAIREAFTGKRGELTTLAMHYGVDRSTIERIVHGKRWRHV
jgi:hypothetical protein